MTNYSTFKLAFLSFALLLFTANTFSQTQISGIQAKLFYQNSSTFSPDVFTTQSDLWNVYLDYVYSVLVIVEVTGKSNGRQFDSPQRIDFSARYKPFEGLTKEITVRKATPAWFDENGKANVGFWIDNIGCDPVRISAKIRGQKSTFRKSIKFGCGE